MPRCRICKASDDKQSIRAPFVYGGDKEHNFWQCEICEAIYLYPIPSTEEENFFYRKEFERFMSSRVGDHRDWSNAEKHKISNLDQVERRVPFIQDYLKPGIDLLEIGCSSGFMLDAFSKYDVNCFGVEPSGEFGDFLSKSGHKSVTDLSEVDHLQFDVITHFFVFEHIRDPFEFLTKTYSMLKEGGVMIMEFPCANDPLTSQYSIDAFEKFYWSIAHHYYYTPNSISFILNRLGYEYKLVPEQRYDLSNHMTWMMFGKPGGQGKFTDFLGTEVVDAYRKNLIDTWHCDTIFLYVWK